MKTLSFTILILVVCSVALASDQTGTESPFDFGVGARDLALGGAAIATPSDLDAVFWNPAALSAVPRSGVTGFHAKLFESGIVYQSFGGVHPTLHFGTFAVGISRIGINDIEARDINNQLTEHFDDSRMSFRFGFGTYVKNTSVGASLHLEHQSIYNYSSTSSPGVDLALERSFTTSLSALPQFSFAVVGRNIIPPSQKFLSERVSFPLSLETATTGLITPWKQQDISAALSMAVIKVSHLDPTFRCGLEVTLASRLAIRGGYRDGHLSTGIGLNWYGISFDYAVLDQDYDMLHLLNMSISFGPTKTERILQQQYLKAQAVAQLSEERLAAKYKHSIDSLTAVAESAARENDLQLADNCLDRALFLSTVMGEDTTAIATKHRDILAGIAKQTRLTRLMALEDSTRQALSAEDWQSAGYYARIILTDSSQHKEALLWQQLAEKEITESASRNNLIIETLRAVDSLVEIGEYSAALISLGKAESLDSANQSLKDRYNRIRILEMQSRCENALSDGSLQTAQTLLDSAKILFPDQDWIQDMTERLQEARRMAESVKIKQAGLDPPETQSLSEEEERNALNLYEEAARMFSIGNLHNAILLWESIERLAPNFKDVRKRLSEANKFIGIEAYGRNNLDSAVTAWRTALIYTPDSNEIRTYLQRAETEFKRRQRMDK